MKQYTFSAPLDKIEVARILAEAPPEVPVVVLPGACGTNVIFVRQQVLDKFIHLCGGIRFAGLYLSPSWGYSAPVYASADRGGATFHLDVLRRHDWGGWRVSFSEEGLDTLAAKWAAALKHLHNTRRRQVTVTYLEWAEEAK